MTAPEFLTFVRHVDGLRYHFERCGERNGRPAYRRSDGNVWCVWSSAEGWHCEGSDGVVNSRPVGSHGGGLAPPATVWRSFKNGRSYLYDVRFPAPEA
ncbi:hypothetical protein H3146_01770 [Streptomyces sp. OF3]|uniref:Uncharacterized protein n=1 Tax=Streptomyces alkaliterrae TaxID=2213162 RepID=A0A7W3WGW0_9ACTN|nr:hypothetical protein [Streptomyces alkaliterrae]MBB1252098.1 hypothetical protein [Streptomyces alkaliterrae]